MTLFALCYCVPGLLGHDPWKPDEAYTFGIVEGMLESGEWVVPTVAGIPFIEKPPAMALIAALLAYLCQPWLPLHDGARLATGLCVAATAWFVFRAARTVWGGGAGRAGVLLLFAAPGLVIHGHALIPDVLLMASFAAAAAGLVAIAIGGREGGALLGTATGVGFLAKGLIAPGVIGLAAIALPALVPAWRSRRICRQLAIASLAVLPWMLIWPALLYHRSPALFAEWFWDNNVGRFLGFSVDQLGAEHTRWFWTLTYPWFLFPAWLFIALGWRRLATALRADAGLLAVVVLAAALLVVLGVARSARVIYALPLIPLAAIVAGGLVDRPPRFDRALVASGALIGLCGAVIATAIWLSLVTIGRPPAWTWLVERMPESFDLPVWRFGTIGACALAVAIAVFLSRARDMPNRGLATWCAGIAITYGLAATLLLPWIDAARSYRMVFEALAALVPRTVRCVESSGLGESERAMLKYTTGLVARPLERPDGARCPAILAKFDRVDSPGSPREGWVQAWVGARAGDHRERIALYLPAVSAAK